MKSTPAIITIALHQSKRKDGLAKLIGSGSRNISETRFGSIIDRANAMMESRARNGLPPLEWQKTFGERMTKLKVCLRVLLGFSVIYGMRIEGDYDIKGSKIFILNSQLMGRAKVNGIPAIEYLSVKLENGSILNEKNN